MQTTEPVTTQIASSEITSSEIASSEIAPETTATDATGPQTAPNGKPKKSLKRELLEWALTLISAVAIALVIRAVLFEPFVVKGNSMNDTLANGEVMFATKYDYLLGEPQRFDVVICRYPNRDENFVKRIVGLPGDVVAVRDGYLFVNGERFEEEYIVHRPNYTYDEYTVGPGEYFVLGDNRSNSNDSHYVGTLSRKQIVAHVRSVLLPLGKIRGIE